MQKKLPILAGIGVAVLLIVVILTGGACVTTSGGCQEWLEEKAAEAVADGETPPVSAQFYGLGVGFCVLD